jgi:aspartate/methionine/tyrosine aminotransferase
VLATTGGAEANFVSFWQLFQPGDTVAVVLPTYAQVPGLVESFGGRVAPVPLLEESGWQPDLDALATALASGARVVLVTNPNNPTGASLTEQSMAGIAEMTARHGAWILADEVYAGAELGDTRTPTFWGRHEKVLITNSLSKAYGLPGLRLGWIVGPPASVAELWGRTDYTTIAPASLSDTLACIALRPDTRTRLRSRTQRIVTGNLALLEDWLSSQGGRFTYRAPDAGAICFARYDSKIGSTELAEKLRLDQNVLVVPGDHFARDHHVRLGYGIPEAELLEALDRVRTTFDGLTA